MIVETDKPIVPTMLADIIYNDADAECHCHALPCSIDFTGRAPVQVYFTPHLVTEKEEDDAKEEGKANDKSSPAKVYSAQFRGRQLLALEPKQNDSDRNNNQLPLHGRLLEVDFCKAKNSEDRVKVKGKFSSIFEWKHECQPAVLQNFSDNNNRVKAALQWCEVAQAVS